MSQGIWVALAIVAGVCIYVIVRVIEYARRSREQWQQVDRSKLREWEDDDEW